MVDPRHIKARAEKAAERTAARNDKQPDMRQLDAIELIADTLIEIRDILIDMRVTAESNALRMGHGGQ
jgi:hypothetical protein